MASDPDQDFEEGEQQPQYDLGGRIDRLEIENFKSYRYCVLCAPRSIVACNSHAMLDTGHGRTQAAKCTHVVAGASRSLGHSGLSRA